MKRFTVIETMRRHLKRFGHAKLIAVISLIVITLSIGCVVNAVTDDAVTVSAPTVYAETDSSVVEETSTSIEEDETTETTDATTSETTEKETTVTEETTTEAVTTTTTETTKEETTTTEVVTTTESTTTTTVVTTEVHIVYKPKTHYFHMSNCRWYDKTCVDTWDINTIEGRICSECHPDIELVNVYTPPQTTAPPASSNDSGSLPITQSEFYMLANLVAHEYGADWVATAEKAKVVATVMNRVRMSKFPNTVREVILQRNQYCWVPDSYYWKRTTQGCKDAVTYYFNHRAEFSSSITSFYGNGRVNIFY